MKIIFYRNEHHEIQSELSENNVCGEVTKVRFSLDENDLIERRRYNFHTFMQAVKSRKIKLPGMRNDSKV